jgi:hypothetical protein
MATAEGKRDLFATASRADILSEKEQADEQKLYRSKVPLFLRECHIVLSVQQSKFCNSALGTCHAGSRGITWRGDASTAVPAKRTFFP